MEKEKGKEWTLIIKPEKRLLDVDLKGIWRYRDLWYMYIKRDIVTVYKQTVLGPLWFFIQPIFTTIMYMFVFGGLAGISTDGVPQPLFYLSGITLWNYFSSCFNGSSNTFSDNAGIFGKVYFPRLVVPLASLTSNLIKMVIQLLLFISVYIYYAAIGGPGSINSAAFLFPVLVLMLAFHAMSWGLIVSSLTSKYRDLRHLVGFGLQLLMLSVAGEKYGWAIRLNPLTPIFEAFKYGVLGNGSLSWGGLLYSFVFMVVMLFVSIIIFNRVERHFMDTV